MRWMPTAYLADNNAYAFFQKIDDLIITGPSTTNVGDLQIILFTNATVQVPVTEPLNPERRTGYIQIDAFQRTDIEVDA